MSYENSKDLDQHVHTQSDQAPPFLAYDIIILSYISCLKHHVANIEDQKMCNRKSISLTLLQIMHFVHLNNIDSFCQDCFGKQEQHRDHISAEVFASA